MDNPEAFEKRRKFSELYQRMFEVNPKLQSLISDLEKYFKDNNIFYFHYGGRMWHHLANKYLKDDIPEFNDLEKSAILNGNHDMLAVSPENNYEDVYKHVERITKLLQKEYQNAITTLNRDNDYVVLKVDYDKEDHIRTITIGRAFRIYLSRKKPSLTRKTNARETTYIAPEDYSDDTKLIFYLELGKNREGESNYCINVENARRFMIDNNENKNYLNIVGLIMMSQFLNVNRDKEKGAPIDEAREQIIKNKFLNVVYKLLRVQNNAQHGGVKSKSKRSKFRHKSYRAQKNKSYRISRRSLRRKRTRRLNVNAPESSSSSSLNLSPTPPPSPEKIINISMDGGKSALLYITLVLFPLVFNTEHFIMYNNVRGIIIEKIFKLYNDKIKDDMNKFDSYLLDRPGPNTGLSMRQIIMLFITHLAAGFEDDGELKNEYSLQLSGGDVFRAYIPEILTTADIDTKLMYKKAAYVNIMQFMFVICTLIVFYLHEKKYFSFKDQFAYDIDIGNVNFKRFFHTENQEIIPTSRVLPHFTVPLVSIDIKLNGYIECPSINFNETIYHPNGAFIPKQKITAVHYAAPLDISLIHSKQIEQRTNCKPKHLYREYIMNLPTRENKYCIPPYPSLEYLIADLQKMLDNNTRPHKKEKDEKRLNKINKVKIRVEKEKEEQEKLKQEGFFVYQCKEKCDHFDLNRVLDIQQAKVKFVEYKGDDETRKQEVKKINDNVLNYIQKYKEFNDTVFDLINEILTNKAFVNKKNINSYIQIISQYWERFSLSYDNLKLFKKVLIGAKLYSTHIKSYNMPHGIDKINNQVNDADVNAMEDDAIIDPYAMDVDD